MEGLSVSKLGGHCLEVVEGELFVSCGGSGAKSQDQFKPGERKPILKHLKTQQAVRGH